LSHTFKAGQVKEQETQQEFANLQRALNEAQPEFTLQILHAQPTRVFKGMVVYADGTDWNPGSGEGIYRRNKANAAWVFVG
jgi:hypothetical protein